MCLRSHIMNGLLTSFCSVCMGKYLPSVYPHRPRSFVARSVRKPQANTFPYRPRSRLITFIITLQNTGMFFKVFHMEIIWILVGVIATNMSMDILYENSTDGFQFPPDQCKLLQLNIPTHC